MGILDKILRRRGGDHEQWLRDHPGKGHFTVDASPVTPAEQAATRSRMEAELEAQKVRREAE